MPRFSAFLLVSGLVLPFTTACRQDKGVLADKESGSYQPRPAPAQPQTAPENLDLGGELLRVDMTARTFAVRVENGMEQTFAFDESTVVTGLDKEGSAAKSAVRRLVGKEGSEISVKWHEDDRGKLATKIEVAQVGSSSNATQKGRRH
jgi:hypothetical protein